MMKRVFCASILCFFLCSGLLPGFSGSSWAKTGLESVTIDRKRPEGPICPGKGALFVVQPPSGWVNDAETASKFGVCWMFMPEGHTFHDAPAVMYGRTMRRKAAADLEAAADEVVAATMRTLEQGGNPLPDVRGIQPENESRKGLFTMRLFDKGPKPNEYEAGAYRLVGDDIFFIILSAREKSNRDAFLPQLEEAMGRVAVAVPRKES